MELAFINELQWLYIRLLFVFNYKDRCKFLLYIVIGLSVINLYLPYITKATDRIYYCYNSILN